MKKSALITYSIIALIGLTAFTYQNSRTGSNQDEVFDDKIEIADDEPALIFFYDYGPRFEGITKAQIANASSIVDLFKKDQIQDIVSYGKVRLMIIKNESQTEIRELSEGILLTDAQLKMLQSLDYSDNFNLRADCKRLNAETNEIEESFHSPHLTIVPEKQAEYNDGREAFLKFIEAGSTKEKAIAIAEKKKLRPAKLYFTVTKKGKIANVKIGNHSGYKSLDDKLITLLNALPGKWQSAENDKGEKIDQELVVSYGFEGC